MPLDTKYGTIMVEREPGNKFIPDEPVFLLRARDRTALATLSAYYESCKALGAPIQHLDAVDDVINNFRKWQHENIDLVKVPG